VGALVIRYVQRQQIDSEKWDECIDRSANRLIYAYSFYLDAMSDHWDALIVGEYEFVMPLTWRKKFGIRYLYPPPFTQQGGVFSKAVITPEIVQNFLDVARQHFRFADIYLNFANGDSGMQYHCNLLLSLAPAYDQLRNSYNKDLRNNLRIAAKHPLTFALTDDYKTVLRLFKDRYASQIRSVTNEGYDRFACLLAHPSTRFQSVVRTVTLNDTDLLAAALLLVSGNRMYLLQSYVSDTGREMKANHFLIDRLIHEFAGSNLLLDFEGSDIAGIASFYSNFGATDQPYYFYHHNNLPGIARVVKKLHSNLKNPGRK
jgi:hypothetical protein